MPLLKIVTDFPYFKKFFLFLLLFAICSCAKERPAHMTFSGIMDTDITRVSSQAHGILKELNFDEGMEVKEGQVLADVETESLGYQLEQNRSVIEELGNQYKATLSQLETAKIEKRTSS